MTATKRLWLDAALGAALLFGFQIRMFAAQTPTGGLEAKSSSATSTPQSSGRSQQPSPALPAQNRITLTTLLAAPERDAQSKHDEAPPTVAWCPTNSWYYPPVTAVEILPPQAATGTSQEVVPLAPRLKEHAEDRVQAAPRIGEIIGLRRSDMSCQAIQV